MRAAARRQEPGAALALAEQAEHLQLPLRRPLAHTGKSASRVRQSPRPTLSTGVGHLCRGRRVPAGSGLGLDARSHPDECLLVSASHAEPRRS